MDCAGPLYRSAAFRVRQRVLASASSIARLFALSRGKEATWKELSFTTKRWHFFCRWKKSIKGRSPAFLTAGLGRTGCGNTPPMGIRSEALAARCRFPFRKLACGNSSLQRGLSIPPTRPRPSPRSEALECVQLAAAFLPASSLAGISTPASVCIRIPSLQPRVPASELAGEKAAASCTHSKASLRLPSQAAGCGGFGNNQQSAMTVKERVARACSVGPRFVPQ